MCHATDAVDVKERIHYAVWFANLALHRSQEIAAMLVNSSDVRYHTTRRTLTRMLDAGAAGPPVHHCSADSPAQRLDGTGVAKTVYEELRVSVQGSKARGCTWPGHCLWRLA